MSPPDTNLEKQKRRHRFPIIGMGLVVVFAVGVVIYWIAEEAAMAPGPNSAKETITPADIREGSADVPSSTSTEAIGPGDPDVEVNP